MSGASATALRLDRPLRSSERPPKVVYLRSVPRRLTPWMEPRSQFLRVHQFGLALKRLGFAASVRSRARGRGIQCGPKSPFFDQRLVLNRDLGILAQDRWQRTDPKDVLSHVRPMMRIAVEIVTLRAALDNLAAVASTVRQAHAKLALRRPS